MAQELVFKEKFVFSYEITTTITRKWTPWFKKLSKDNDTYRSVLELVRNKISKQTTNIRNSISAEERLTATLLATENSYEDLKFSTGISARSSGKIIPECCLAIFSKGIHDLSYVSFYLNNL
jgi:hypothetical protein